MHRNRLWLRLLLAMMTVAMVTRCPSRKCGRLHEFIQLPKARVAWVYGSRIEPGDSLLVEVMKSKLKRSGYECSSEMEVPSRNRDRSLAIFGTPMNNTLLARLLVENGISLGPGVLSIRNRDFTGDELSVVFAFNQSAGGMTLLMASEHMENLQKLSFGKNYDFIVYDRIGPRFFGYIVSGSIDNKQSRGARRPSWVKMESDNFCIFYDPRMSEQTAAHIRDYDEAALKEIHHITNLDPPGKIAHYVYRSRAQKEEVTGNQGNAHCNTKYMEIHSVYSKGIKAVGSHEVMHVVASRVGSPPALIGEGLAVHVEGKWNGRTLGYWLAKFNGEGRMIPLDSLLETISFRDTDQEVAYVTAGSYVGFLISRHGIGKLLELYRSVDQHAKGNAILDAFLEIYGMPFEQSEQEWFRVTFDGS